MAGFLTSLNSCAIIEQIRMSPPKGKGMRGEVITSSIQFSTHLALVPLLRASRDITPTVVLYRSTYSFCLTRRLRNY